MDDYTYQVHEVEDGTHILVFKNGLFERKVFVSVSEYNPECLVNVISRGFHVLFCGTNIYAIKWLQRNKDNPDPAMVTVGKDFQVIPVREYIALHG